MPVVVIIIILIWYSKFRCVPGFLSKHVDDWNEISPRHHQQHRRASINEHSFNSMIASKSNHSIIYFPLILYSK